MSRRMNGYKEIICRFLSEDAPDAGMRLNRMIEAYNRKAERRAEADLSECRPLKLRPVRDAETLSLWRGMKGYVLSRLEGTVYYRPFCNSIGRRSSHAAFERKNYMSRATYYKYVDKGYEIAKEYLIYNRLVEL